MIRALQSGEDERRGCLVRRRSRTALHRDRREDWYNVTAVNGATFADPGTLGNNSASGTITAAGKHERRDRVHAQYTGTGSMGGNKLDAAKLSAWAIANSKSESGNCGECP